MFIKMNLAKLSLSFAAVSALAFSHSSLAAHESLIPDGNDLMALVSPKAEISGEWFFEVNWSNNLYEHGPVEISQFGPLIHINGINDSWIDDQWSGLTLGPIVIFQSPGGDCSYVGLVDTGGFGIFGKASCPSATLTGDWVMTN